MGDVETKEKKQDIIDVSPKGDQPAGEQVVTRHPPKDAAEVAVPATPIRLTPVFQFDRDAIDLIKRTVAKGATDDELRLFIATAQRSGLDPIARQIYFVKYGNQMSIQTGIDGFRLIAERSAHYKGQKGPYYCGTDGEWNEVWLDEKNPPAAAKVGVIRDDFSEPLWAVAQFNEYAQSSADGGLRGMWRKMPRVMIGKCAEALALRKAFPNELSGLYTSDEMEQAGQPTVPPATAPEVAKPEPAKPEAAAITPFDEDDKEELRNTFRAILDLSKNGNGLGKTKAHDAVQEFQRYMVAKIKGADAKAKWEVLWTDNHHSTPLRKILGMDPFVKKAAQNPEETGTFDPEEVAGA